MFMQNKIYNLYPEVTNYEIFVVGDTHEIY